MASSKKRIRTTITSAGNRKKHAQTPWSNHWLTWKRTTQITTTFASRVSPARSYSNYYSHRGDPIETVLILLCLFLCACAVPVFIVSKRTKHHVETIKQRYNIPKGTITYTDLNIPAKPLFSPRYHLAGKPDYIIKQNQKFIPVEVKAGSSQHPKRNHVLQLAAYCALVEETFNTFVPCGLLVYNNASYTIPFDPQLRFELEETMHRIRENLRNQQMKRNHNDPGKCRFCSMRTYCTEKLI